jgi:hypothetical protein
VSSVHRALSSSFSSASGDGTDQSASGGSTSARAAARCTRSMAGNRDVAATRSRSPGACGPSATRRFGSASTTRKASQASGNRGFGASGARHPRGSPYSMQRSGSMSRPREAGCPMSSPGARKSRFALQSSSSARGHGKRSARPKKTGFGQFDTQVWSCPRSPSRFVLSRLLRRSCALHGGQGALTSLRAHALVRLLRVVRGSTERRVEPLAGDCRFRRRAAVSPCAPAPRPFRLSDPCETLATTRKRKRLDQATAPHRVDPIIIDALVNLKRAPTVNLPTTTGPQVS